MPFSGGSKAPPGAVIRYVATRGNPQGHIILRGASSGPNYSKEWVDKTAKALVESDLQPRIMIDCSHANSNKDYTRQAVVCRDVAGQIAAGNKNIIGVMIESNLVAGAQRLIPGQPLVYGQSITDACIDWPETYSLLKELAAASRTRRNVVEAVHA